MNPSSILITGANRGLGLELVRQVLAKYNSVERVFPTYRNQETSKELFQLAAEDARVIPVLMDVGKPEMFPEAVEKVANVVGDKGLSLLVNNAGVFSNDGQSLDAISRKTMEEYMQINLFGAIFVTQAFLPLLEKSSKTLFADGWATAGIVNYSSRLGSIADNSSGGLYASRCTRTALNAATRSMSIDLRSKKIFAVSINPGWVQTDQGGSKAPLTPEVSISGILNVLDNLTPDQSGLAMQYDGVVLPW